MKSLIITSIAGVLALVSSVTGLPTDLKRSHDFAGIPINQCEHGWFLYNSFCYLASASVKTRSNAQKFCKDSGAELVKITSQAENDFVLALARKRAPSVPKVWIGLQYESGDKTFYWSDGSFPTYKNWAPGEPNGNAREPCGHMYTARRTPVRRQTSSGYWNDEPCSFNPYSRKGLVCKKLANQ